MFGLGLGEVLCILFLAVLVFGPRFLVNGSKRVFNSLQGFNESFQEARQEEIPKGSVVKVIKPGEETSP